MTFYRILKVFFRLLISHFLYAEAYIRNLLLVASIIVKALKNLYYVWFILI